MTTVHVDQDTLEIPREILDAAALHPAPVAPRLRIVQATPLLTVGIEPMPDGWRETGPAHLYSARTAVVERFQHQITAILCTDNNPTRHATLSDVAHAYAETYGARLNNPQWPTCAWCGRLDPHCPDVYGHARLAAGSETSWRGPAARHTGNAGEWVR
jgi:hypothetical protein